jgi:hypothetical protein
MQTNAIGLETPPILPLDITPIAHPRELRMLERIAPDIWPTIKTLTPREVFVLSQFLHSWAIAEEERNETEDDAI